MLPIYVIPLNYVNFAGCSRNSRSENREVCKAIAGYIEFGNDLHDGARRKRTGAQELRRNNASLFQYWI